MIKKWSVLCLALAFSAPAALAEEVKYSPKINYANNLLMNSKTAKRLEAMGTEEAKQALQKARDLLESAKEGHRNGNDKQANALSGLALRKFTEAAKLLPKSDSANKVLIARYKELTEEIASYLEWYDTADYVSGDEKATISEVKDGLADAEGLYNNKSYEKANNILSKLLNQVVAMSNRSMTESEIVMSLDFETPEEEHKYELARNNEYKRLIPIAIEQKQPKGGKLMLFQRFVKKAEKTREQADQEMNAQNIEASIKALQSSTDQYMRALSMIGIR